MAPPNKNNNNNNKGKGKGNNNGNQGIKAGVNQAMVKAAAKRTGELKQQDQQLNMKGQRVLGHNLLRAQLDRMLGSSPEASGWVIKSLHPMDETPTPGDGRIPDQTTGATVSPEGRFQLSITGVVTPSQTWNCDIWMPNIVDAPLLWRTWTSGTTPLDTAWNIGFVPSFPNGSISLDASTVNLPALVVLADNYRATYKGVTVHLIANSLNDSGVVYGAQWADTPTNPQTTKEGSKVDLPGFQYNKLPLTEDSLFQKQPGTVSFEARQGMYMPFKYMQATHELQESSSPGYLTYRTGDGPDDITYVTVRPGDPSITNPYVAVTGTTNFQSGMILFRGLNPGASLNVKFRERLEATPTADKPWAPFGEASPLYDPDALTAQIRVSQKLALAFPANYNDAGKILKDIWEWLRGAGKSVSKMKIPFVSDAAGLIGTAVDGLYAL